MAIIDVHIGSRLRELRLLLGLSGRELGELMDLSVQQVHKYECGADRISAGLLYSFGQKLQVSITHFFEGVDKDLPVRTAPKGLTAQFMRDLARIPDKKSLEAVREIVRVMAAQKTRSRTRTLSNRRQPNGQMAKSSDNGGRSSPARRQQQRAIMEARWADPIAGEKQRTAIAAPDSREKIRAASKARWADPKMRAKILKGMKMTMKPLGRPRMTLGD